MRLVLVAFGFLIACASEDECPAPDKPTYSCEPITSGVGGCIGGCYQSGGPAAADPDKVFPVGCVTTLTFCPPLFRYEPQKCTCEGSASGAEWVAPL